MDSGIFSGWIGKLIELAFGNNYFRILQERVEANDLRDIYSITDLARKYPDVKDKVIAIAKTKIKSQREGLDDKYSEDVKKKYMNFDQGIKLVKSLIDSVVSAGFGNSSLTDAIFSTFKSAVCTDGAFGFVEYHTSQKSRELYEIETIKNGEGIRLFYFYIKVDARRIENFLYNESETKLTAEYKIIKFENLQSLLEWAST